MEENEQPTKTESEPDQQQLDEDFVDHHSRPTDEAPAAKKDNRSAHSSQNSLPLAEIRNGLVILKDGSFKVVIKVEAVNFDLMSGVEQEAVEYAYQAFLNSLYFPIQISIQSRRVDSDTYLKKLQASFKSQNNMLLAVLVEDHLAFLEELMLESDIMNKSFYVVVPFYDTELTKTAATRAGKHLFGKLLNFNRRTKPISINEKSLDKARKELRYRVATVVEGLRSCGIISHPLDTQQLIAMYYEYYNPETIISRPLGSFNELVAPFVSKAGEYRRREEELPSDRDELFDFEDDKEEAGLTRSPILAEGSRRTDDEDEADAPQEQATKADKADKTKPPADSTKETDDEGR